METVIDQNLCIGSQQVRKSKESEHWQEAVAGWQANFQDTAWRYMFSQCTGTQPTAGWHLTSYTHLYHASEQREDAKRCFCGSDLWC